MKLTPFSIFRHTHQVDFQTVQWLYNTECRTVRASPRPWEVLAERWAGGP